MKLHRLLVGALALAGCAGPAPASGKDMLQIQLRSRSKSGEPSTTAVQWDPKKTAFVICDMWDDHWCKGAAKRVGELAGPMNRLIAEARRRGAFILHAPSTCVSFYKDTPARKRAQESPKSPAPAPLSD